MRKLLHFDENRFGALGCNTQLEPQSFGSHLIRTPCPACGSNMLTEEDYNGAVKLLKRLHWINKWFGWLGTKGTPAVGRRLSARVHKGRTTMRDHGKVTYR